jgi:hypothetical protein
VLLWPFTVRPPLMSKDRRWSVSSKSVSSRRFKRCLVGTGHGHGFYQAIPLYGISLAFSLHLAWYWGPLEPGVTRQFPLRDGVNGKDITSPWAMQSLVMRTMTVRCCPLPLW